ncbi:MAG TPA: hypothetical protein ENJ42_05875, partial [Hellea balneolensis]|nr:hypothetical protein [Hellea balneolensis]
MAGQSKKPTKVRKNTGRKTAPAKAVAQAKPAAKSRDSLAKLRAHVDDIEKRLKRANSLTRSSVKSLTSAYETLAARSGHEPGELTNQIEALSTQLHSLIEQTRKDVAHDLQVVLEDPRFDTLASALTKANKRLSAAEREQANAIAQINDQIANLATAIDKRLARETRAREAKDHELETRIDDIEAASTEALSMIGKKVVDVSEAIQTRTQSELETIKRQANEHFLAKQKQFEEHRAELERRVEAIEDDQRNTVPSLERRMVTLATRVEALEDARGSAELGEGSVPPPPVYEPAPANPPQSAPPIPSATLSNIPSDVRDAFSPDDPEPITSVPPPVQVYGGQTTDAQSQAAYHMEPVQSEYTGPVEYTGESVNPNDYQTPLPANNPYAERLSGQQPEVLANTYGQQVPSVETPFDGTPSAETPPPPMPDTMTAMAPPPLQVPPAPDALVDPAPETMEAARPGADDSKPKRAGKGGKPSLTLSRPIKLAALMVGVAAIGLIATKTIMPMVFGKPTPSGQSTGQVPQQQLATVEGLDDGDPSGALETLDTPQTQTPPIQTVDAVGDYSETMKAPELGP